MFDPNEFLTPHFQLKEFLHNGSIEGLTLAIHENLKWLAKALEQVREDFGNAPIHINSGFRTPLHNKDVGGAPGSTHLKGLAADITIHGFTPSRVQIRLKDWPGGLGSYKTWSHVDLGSKRRWPE